MCTYRLQGSSTHGAVAGSPAPSGQLGKDWVPWAGLKWGSQPRGGSMRVPAGAAQGHQGLAPSPTTTSQLQNPSPRRWQVTNEIAELVKKWLRGALAEE